MRRPVYCYNLLGMQQTKVAAGSPLEPGRHRLVMTFDYDGGGPGMGGTVRLTVDGDIVGRAGSSAPSRSCSPWTRPSTWVATAGPPVSDDYTAETSEFTGVIHQVRLEIAEGAPNFSHLIDPLQRLAVALARQ